MSMCAALFPGYWEGDRADEVAGLIPRAPPQASGRGENIENGDAEAADAGDTLDEQNGSGEGAVEREEMVVDD